MEIPSTALNQLANHPDVVQISKDHGGQLDLDDTAKAIGSDHLWNIGCDGDSVWDVAVVDSGESEANRSMGKDKRIGD